MKIAVLVYDLDRIGGINKHALYLSREFVALGHQVDIYCVEYDKDRCYPELLDGFQVKSLRPANQPKTGEIRRPYGMRMANYLWGLRKYYRDQERLCTLIPPGYDVINPHGNYVSWTAAAYKQQHSTPAVWMCNDFMPIASYRGEINLDFRRRIELEEKKILASPFTAHDRAAVLSIDKIAVLSEQVKSQMMEYYAVDPCIVRAGVEVSKFAQGDGPKSRSQNKIQKSAFILLTVCTLLPRRRLEDVIQAVRILIDHGKDVHYLVVGRTEQSPDYFQRLQAEVIACNLAERVRFVGEVTDEELPDYYHACDAFIWASDENQSWGLAAMEAMAAGKPVIVSSANGLAEVLEDEKTALIVPPSSPAKIAEAVRRLAEDRSLAESVAMDGNRLMCENYTWRKNAEEILALFKEAIAQTHARKSPYSNDVRRVHKG